MKPKTRWYLGQGHYISINNISNQSGKLIIAVFGKPHIIARKSNYTEEEMPTVFGKALVESPP